MQLGGGEVYIAQIRGDGNDVPPVAVSGVVRSTGRHCRIQPKP